MSEPDYDERDRQANFADGLRSHNAVVAGMTSMVAGLVPFGVILSVATGAHLFGSVCATLFLGLMVAFPLGTYCGLIGWSLTRNTSIDSRVMACTLAAVLQLTILGWLIVICIRSKAI